MLAGRLAASMTVALSHALFAGAPVGGTHGYGEHVAPAKKLDPAPVHAL